MISMLPAQIYHLALYPVTAMLGLLVMDILAQVSNKDNFIHSCPGFSFDVSSFYYVSCSVFYLCLKYLPAFLLSFCLVPQV